MNQQTLLSTHNLFMSRLLLSLLGAYIAQAYRHVSHDYWLLMMFLFSVIAVAPSYYQFRQKNDNFKDFVQKFAALVRRFVCGPCDLRLPRFGTNFS